MTTSASLSINVKFPWPVVRAGRMHFLPAHTHTHIPYAHLRRRKSVNTMGKYFMRRKLFERKPRMCFLVINNITDIFKKNVIC